MISSSRASLERVHWSLNDYSRVCLEFLKGSKIIGSSDQSFDLRNEKMDNTSSE